MKGGSCVAGSDEFRGIVDYGPFSDDAVIRRFKKRIYVGLPSSDARRQLLESLLKRKHTTLPEGELQMIADKTENYSNSDLRFLAEEAAMEPVRELSSERVASIKANQLRKITVDDLERSLIRVRPSAKPELIERLESYAKDFGER